MAWDRDKERKAAGKYQIGMTVFALAFMVFWCVMAVSMGAWFMCLFAIPMGGMLIYRLVMTRKLMAEEKKREPWEQPAQPRAEPYREQYGSGFCPWCGGKLEENFQFCPHCGRRINSGQNEN